MYCKTNLEDYPEAKSISHAKSASCNLKAIAILNPMQSSIDYQIKICILSFVNHPGSSVIMPSNHCVLDPVQSR
jgi:hypothetical protein